MKHYKITVSGKVQGVFYRVFTKKKAQELGLNGYVKNMPNGTVCIEAEGTSTQLSQLIDWCKQGPPLSKVENVHYIPGDVVPFKSFVID